MWEPILPNKVILIKIPAQVEKKTTKNQQQQQKGIVSVGAVQKSWE